MTKKRKTRKEKIKSAARQSIETPQMITTASASVIYNLPTITTSNPTVIITPQHAYKRHDYSYVGHDVKKTLLIIGILVILNIGVYFLIQNNIIHLTF